MTTPNNDGPAFPSTVRIGNLLKCHDGMTLRDYFAGQALAGLITLGDRLHDKDYPEGTLLADITASQAYFIADAMLKERDK